MSVIEVKGLSKSFGQNDILKDLDLTVEKGEVIVILGESGCGKSLFLRMLEQLEKPDTGSIKILGEEITSRGADINRIRRRMGMVFQSFNLYSHMTVLKNLTLAPTKLLKMPEAEAEANAHELLASVGLSGTESRLPDTLSGGQKQRVAIARCLMMEPEILLFDEPTSALDPSMVGEVLATIRMLSRQGYTMLIVTHEMEFAKSVASRILFFADKGIYEEGTASDIFDSPRNEKTIAFIRKLKTLEHHITSRSYDLMALQGQIMDFCAKYGLDDNESCSIQLCCEELIGEFIRAHDGKPDITITLEYSEAQKTIDLTCCSKGARYDLFDDNDISDHLGIAIIKSKAESCSYSYENGINTVFASIRRSRRQT